jgi:hypothetical protein
MAFFKTVKFLGNVDINLHDIGVGNQKTPKAK